MNRWSKHLRALLLGMAAIQFGAFFFVRQDLEGKYDQVQVGMTMGDVDRLLGKPTEPIFCTLEGMHSHTGYWAEDLKRQASVSARWKGGGKLLGVRFTRGLVASKSLTPVAD